MKSDSHIRYLSILGFVTTFLIALIAWQSWNYVLLRVQSALAEEQTRTFEELRELALRSDVAGAAGCLEHLFIYYPSGTKQRTGSHLDLTVERHRLAVSREIIAFLRHTTGQDLGDTPESWIERYAEAD